MFVEQLVGCRWNERSDAVECAPRTLATVRPGPVLHIWRDGRELAAVPLDMHAALALVDALLRETRAACPPDRGFAQQYARAWGGGKGD